LSLAAAVAGLTAAWPGAQAADDDDALPLVAVTAIVRDAAIDALYTGMTDALREAGYRDGESVRLRFASAETDAGRAAELVRSFGRDRADIIVAFTEPSVRIAAAERLRVPLVIAGVGPDFANELRRNRRPRLLTGIVDGERFDTPLTLIREIAPSVRTVAVPVDIDKAADTEAMRLLTAFARSIDLAVEQLPVSLENGAIAATIKDYSPADTAILLDKRIFPNVPVERIVAAAEASNLLVFASDQDSVVRGALAAIVVEPYGTGWQVGELVARILEQPSAARTPLQSAEPSYIVINQDTAARAAIEIPDDVLARRGQVIGWADIAGPRPRGKPVAPEPPPPLSEEPKSGTANPRSKPPVQAR
jgi:putative ABC transport system substrate-binding protein